MKNIEFMSGTPIVVDELYVVRVVTREENGTDATTSLMKWTGKEWAGISKRVSNGPNVFFAGPIESPYDMKRRLDGHGSPEANRMRGTIE